MRPFGGNDVGAVFTAILSLVYLWESRDYPILSEYGLSSGFLPLLLGITLLLLSVIWFITNRAGGKDIPWRQLIPSRVPVIIVVMTVIWTALLEIIGTIISLFLLLVVLWFFLEKYSLRKSVLIAFVLSVLTYTMFSVVVGVPLPKGWITFF